MAMVDFFRPLRSDFTDDRHSIEGLFHKRLAAASERRVSSRQASF